MKHTVQYLCLIQGRRSFWVSGRRRSILSADPAVAYCTLPSCPKQSLFFPDPNRHTLADHCFRLRYREKQSLILGDKEIYPHGDEIIARVKHTYAHKQLLCRTHALTQGAKDWATHRHKYRLTKPRTHARTKTFLFYCSSIFAKTLTKILTLALDLALAVSIA